MGLGGDNHALWIDPKDSKHMLLGYDHGLSLTFDGGPDLVARPDNTPDGAGLRGRLRHGDAVQRLRRLAGQRLTRGPEHTQGGGSIPFEDWTTVGGGDGLYNEVDWKDSR